MELDPEAAPDQSSLHGHPGGPLSRFGFNRPAYDAQAHLPVDGFPEAFPVQDTDMLLAACEAAVAKGLALFAPADTFHVVTSWRHSDGVSVAVRPPVLTVLNHA